MLLGNIFPRSVDTKTLWNHVLQRLITRGYGRMTTTPRKPLLLLAVPVLRFRDSTPALAALIELPPRLNHALEPENELAFAPDHPEEKKTD